METWDTKFFLPRPSSLLGLVRLSSQCMMVLEPLIIIKSCVNRTEEEDDDIEVRSVFILKVSVLTSVRML